MDDKGRPRGILSKSDRRLLAGESEIEPKSQQERNARARIRERIGAGLRDFEFLADPDYLEDRDLDRVREPSDTPADTGSEESVPDWQNAESTHALEPDIDPEITNALIEMVAFAFRVKPRPLYLERVFKAGLRRGADRVEPNVEVSDVRISIEDPVRVADRIEAYLDAGWRLSEWEVIFALENDLRPAEDVAAQVREHGTRDDDWTPGDSRHKLPFPLHCPDCGGNIDEEGYCIDCGTFVEDPNTE